MNVGELIVIFLCCNRNPSYPLYTYLCCSNRIDMKIRFFFLFVSSITMLAINNPFYGGISKNTESLASIHTEIRFVEIPDTIPTPPPEALAVSPASAFTSYINDHKTLVKDTIVNLVMAPPTLHQLLVLLLICFALPLLMLQKNLGSLLVFCKKLLKLPCLVCINHKFDLENWKP